MSNLSKEIVFMYSGQGSQYYHMGRELYQKNTVFKKNMDACSAFLTDELERSLIEVIYDDAKKNENFDSILYTHPAIFSIGYSLTQVMLEEGFKPNCLLGYSLGEFVAAVVAGVVSLEDGVKIISRQARMLHEKCALGGMMVVFAPLEYFHQNTTLFKDCMLAGVNYKQCFVVSGPAIRLKEIYDAITKSSQMAYILPVNYPFHSELVSPIREDFLNLIQNIPHQPQSIPVYSCATAGRIHYSKDHFWNVIRNPIQFDQLITRLVSEKDYIFVDLSPTGTLSNFIKHGFNNQVVSLQAMNQFGKNIDSLNNLFRHLAKYQYA